MRIPSFRYLITVIILLGMHFGYAQQAYHDELIRFYQGLPSDIVLRTQTDAKGFLYVATRKGLSQYDGYRFVNNNELQAAPTGLYYSGGKCYFHNQKFGLAQVADIHQKPKSIVRNNYEDRFPNNDHYDNIFVDSKKRIWCTDFNNLKYFTENQLVSKAFSYFRGNKNSESPVDFVEPTPGNVWAFTENGTFSWSQQTDKLIRHPNPDLVDLSILAAFQWSQDVLLIALRNGKIAEFHIRENRLVFRPETHDQIIGFGILNTGLPVAYSKDAIYTMNTDGSYTVLYRSEKAQINHVHIDPLTHILWVSTNKGLVKLTPVEAITNYKFPGAEILQNTAIAIVQDNENTIWLIDSANSVWSFNSKKQWKKHPSPDASVHFRNIDRAGNNLFLSSDKGLFQVLKGQVQKINLPEFPQNATLRKCLLTRNNELWLLFQGIPIQRYNWPSLTKITTELSNKPLFWTENVWNDLIENTDGSIWLGGWAPKGYGIDLFDPKQNRFIEIADLPFNKKNEFFGDYVNRMARASNNRIVVSGYGGINLIDANGKVLRMVDSNNYPIANGHIEGIADDGSGNLVFATGDGLHVYDLKRNAVVRISQIDGLPTDDLIYGFTKLNNNTFAIGTDNGFTIIDVKKLLTPKAINRLEISSVKIDNLIRKTNPRTIELSKDENDITVYFSNLSFSDRQKTFYRYKFKDDTHWNQLGNNPELTLNHIEPGHYALTIQAGNHLGQWQSAALEINLTVHPPYYKATWFYGVLGLFLVLVIISVYAYLLRRQRKESQYQQQIREAEMQTLRAQMNPHFMFNTLNSINSYIIQNKTEAASEYLTTFSKLMRSILEYSKEEFITLENEMQALKLYMDLESMRLEHSFDYTITIAPDLRHNDMARIPPLIVQPFVENAIWHGLLHKPDPGNLYVSAKKEGETKLIIRVEDDGIGREKAREIKKNQTYHKSYGIDITRQRLEMLHPDNSIVITDLADADGNPSGTAVTLTLIL